MIQTVGEVDLSFATGQLIVSNSVDREHQGIAGKYGANLQCERKLMTTRRDRQHDHELFVSLRFPYIALCLSPFDAPPLFPFVPPFPSSIPPPSPPFLLLRSAVSADTLCSLSIGLGMAGTVQRYVSNPQTSLLQGYRAAFYFGSGLAAVAVIVVGLFVRMPKQAQYRE